MPLALRLSRSYSACALLLAMHAAAMIALAMTLPPLAWWSALQGVLLLAVLYSGYRSLREHGLRNAADAIVALRLHQRDGWLSLANGRYSKVELVSGYCMPWLVVIRLLLNDGRRRTLIIPRDAVALEAHRRLRQIVRHLHCLGTDPS